MGAADGTGVGLSVEAPVERVAVFGLAVRAHGKDAHCRLIAVVGHVQHDGEAWAAVSAVDERIAITSVGWGEEFAQAIVAGAGIGRDERAPLATLLAMLDGKRVFVAWYKLLADHAIDTRQRRSFRT